MEAKDEEISSEVARTFLPPPLAPAVLESSTRYAKAPPSKQRPCRKEASRPALVEASGQSGQATDSIGLASVARAKSGAEVVQNYGGHESRLDGDERLGRGQSMQREFGGRGAERCQEQEAQKSNEAVRKVLGPGGEWKRVKTFFAGD